MPPSSPAPPDADQTHPLIATCARGTERALKYELRSLGVTSLSALSGAVRGRATSAQIAKANLNSRVASRVLLGLAEVFAPTEDALLDQLTQVPFEALLKPGATFAVTAHLRETVVTHELHAARRVKDAVVDRYRALGIARPDVDPKNPDVRFVLYWDHDRAELSIDTSGSPLHQRGYRRPGGEAPMRETLAAAILALGYADLRLPFRDPCCGSGTLGIEQALRSLRKAPGLSRPMAIDRWPDDRLGLKAPLAEARAEARDLIRTTLEAPIVISDWHPDAIAASQAQVHAAGLDKLIHIEQVDARKAAYDDEGVVCTNLPFGERLGKQQLQLDGFYRSFGDRLRALPRNRLLLFSAHPQAEYLWNLGRPTKRWSLYSGQIKAMLRRWDVQDDDTPAGGSS